MITGKTSSGFAFSISDEALDNMELLDAIADTCDGKVLAVSKVCRLLLGDEQRKRLYDHLRSESGSVPSGAVSKELLEIFNAGGKETKN